MRCFLMTFIFFSLKDVDGLSYGDAEDVLMQIIGSEAGRFSFY